MVKADIWTEGIADQKFLADVLKAWFGLSFQQYELGKAAVTFEYEDNSRRMKVRIRAAGTLNAFVSEKEWRKKKQDFFDNQSQGIKNLVFADADDDFDTRKANISQTILGVGFDAESELFLWPDHKPSNEKGDLERLLGQIIHPNHSGVFDCFDEYTTCINK
ncbi:MAG: hypothetical protein SFV22_12850, partial [Saprospiraceae bacterium]|nr:hypothetical protein [Saprospiraceae bacterium]